MSTTDASVLICYDRSPGARHAIEYAATLFPGAQADVLNIWSYPLEVSVPGVGSAAAYSERSEENLAADAADEGCEIATGRGLVARPLVAAGSLEGICRTILRVADEQDASVIVLGSRGLGAVRALFLGSVSHAVVHHSHRPVLIVPLTAELDAPETRESALDREAHWALDS